MTAKMLSMKSTPSKDAEDCLHFRSRVAKRADATHRTPETSLRFASSWKRQTGKDVPSETGEVEARKEVIGGGEAHKSHSVPARNQEAAPRDSLHFLLLSSIHRTHNLATKCLGHEPRNRVEKPNWDAFRDALEATVGAGHKI